MPFQRAQTRGVGLAQVRAPQRSGHATADFVLQSFAQSLQYFRTAVGVVLTPDDDIVAALVACKDGDTVLLLPGTYVVRRNLTIAKSVTLRGLGATLELDGQALVQVTANRVTLANLSIVSRSGAADLLSISGNNCMLRDLYLDVDATRAVSVTGDYCGVQGCSFAGTRPAAGADVYFADGATYGIVCGTMWNGAAGSFSLDYRAIDLTSEAANGPAAIINVR